MTDTSSSRAGTEAELRNQLDEWAQAVRAKDVNRVCAHYAADIVAFDAIAELRFQGIDAYRKHWETCMTMCPSGMIFELHDLKVTVGDELAMVHGLNRCGGAGPDGEEMIGWMRMTVCFQKQQGKWRVVHEHFSAPFDPQSDKALWLEP